MSTSALTPGTLNRTSGTTTTPQTSKTKRTSPSLVAQLVCPTPPPGQPLRRQTVIPEHLCPSAAGPVPAVFLVATPLPSIPPLACVPIPSRSPHPWQRTVAHRPSLCSMGGVIVPKPKGPPEPSLARIGLTPAQVHQAQVNLHSASSPLSQSDRSHVSVGDVSRLGVQT